MYIITNLELPCNTVLQSDFSLGVLHLFLQIHTSLSHPALFWKTDFCGLYRWAPLLSTIQFRVLKWRGMERLGCLFSRSSLPGCGLGISLPETIGPATKPSWTQVLLCYRCYCVQVMVPSLPFQPLDDDDSPVMPAPWGTSPSLICFLYPCPILGKWLFSITPYECTVASWQDHP